MREHLLIAERVRRGRRPAVEGPARPRPAPAGRDRRAATRCSTLLGLGDLADEPIEHLSLGKGRLVEVGRALMTAARAAAARRAVVGPRPAPRPPTWPRTLRAVQAEQGFAILLVEHDVELVAGFTERAYVLDFGRMIAEGPTAEVLAERRGAPGLPRRPGGARDA